MFYFLCCDYLNCYNKFFTIGMGSQTFYHRIARASSRNNSGSPQKSIQQDSNHQMYTPLHSYKLELHLDPNSYHRIDFTPYDPWTKLYNLFGDYGNKSQKDFSPHQNAIQLLCFHFTFTCDYAWVHFILSHRF